MLKFILVCILVFGAAVTDRYPLIYIFNILAIAGVFLLCVKNTLTGALKSHRIKFNLNLCFIVFILIFIFIKIGDTKFHWKEKIEIAQGEKEFVECKRAGATIRPGLILSVCSRKDRSNWGYIDVIIYDDSDEIALPIEKRSIEWNSAAISLSRKAPFGVANFSATPISGHYYDVSFYF